jgi:cytochrome c oxidase subunit IV
MSDLNEPPARLWGRSAVVWAVLVSLALVSLGTAYLPLGEFKTPAVLAIAAIMAVLLWLFLMDLVGAETLVRLIAAAGLLWLSFMFALTLSDYLFRPCETSGEKSMFCAVQNFVF